MSTEDENNTKSFVLDSLNAQMRCGILSGKDGKTLIIHDQKIQEPVQWIEYNPAERSFLLIYKDGSQQALGIKIDEKMSENLKNTKTVFLVHIDDDQYHHQKVNLIVQSH